jgi:anti-anti-sigma factor
VNQACFAWQTLFRVEDEEIASISALRLLHFEMDGDFLVVAPQGDCSSLAAATLEVELRDILAHISAHPAIGLVVDLEQAPYFGSTMLGALIKLWRSMTVVQGQVALCNVSPAELDVLTATRLNSVWAVYPTRAAALAALRS